MTTSDDVERVVRVSGPDNVTLRWVCGGMVSQHSRFAQVFVFKRCGHEFTAEHPRQEYERRECRARCPSCGYHLTQKTDGCEEVTT